VHDVIPTSTPSAPPLSPDASESFYRVEFYGVSPYLRIPVSFMPLVIVASDWEERTLEWPWTWLVSFVLWSAFVYLGVVCWTELDGATRTVTWRWKLWGVLPFWRLTRSFGDDNCLGVETLKQLDGSGRYSYQHQVVVRGRTGQTTLCQFCPHRDAPAPAAIAFLKAAERLLALPIDASGREYLRWPEKQDPPLSPRARRWMMVGAVGFGFAGLVMGYNGAAELVRGVQSYGWTEVTAAVVEPPVQGGQDRQFKLKYAFTVDGVRFTSDWQLLGSPWTDDSPGEWFLRKKLPVGGDLQVYYDERDPRRSATWRGPRWDGALMAAMGIVLGALAWFLLQNARAEPTAQKTSSSAV
jgi:hypothetical protein